MWRSSVLLVCVLATRAHADKAAADAAFSEGKRLMQAGKIAEACTKFEVSQQEDPQIGTALNIADCHEQVGRIATAWAEFRAAGELAKVRGDDREKFAKEREDKLAPHVSYVTLNGTVDHATLDGRDVTALLGVAIPVDPGEHVIVAGATTTIKIEKPATKLAVDVPIAREPEPIIRRNKTRTTIGLVTAGAGLVITGVGLYFGKRAYSLYDDSRAFCDDQNHCDPKGASLIDDSRSAATKSNIFIGVGVAAIATGAVIWLTAPKERISPVARIQPVVSPTMVAGVLDIQF